MKYLLGIILIIFLVPGTARGVEFDASLLSTCLKLASDPSNESLHRELFDHPHIQLIQENLPRHAEISIDQISSKKERLQNYAATLSALETELPALATHASEFLGAGAVPSALSIRLVCGVAYDAFGFQKNGKTFLFANLPLINPDFFPHLLRHEIWHVAYRNQNARTAKSFEDSPNALKQLSFIMLNEGVGHYYSFRRRVEPTIVYDNWQERTDELFMLLNENVSKLAAVATVAQERELLWTSQAGVPFWKKWGATSGAVITFRLRNKLGLEALKPLIKEGPCAFLSRYHKEASQLPNWQNIPKKLVTAACLPH